METMNRKNFLRSLTGLSLAGLAVPGAHAAATDARADVKALGAKGDGKSDDTAVFQRCLQQFGEAYVPAGTYVVNQLLLDGTRLSGIGTLKLTQGEDCVIVQGRGASVQGLRFATVSSRAKSEIRLREGAEDVTVSHCSFDGKAYSVLAADQNTTDDSKLTYRRPVQRVQFVGNVVRGYVCPLYLHSVNEAVIQGNFFSESFYDAVRIRQACERVLITGNHFTNVGISPEPVSRDAVDTFWSGRELVITDNIIKRPGHIGLDLKGHEPTGRYHTQHVLVANNHIEEANFAGILLSSGGAANKGKTAVGPFVVEGNVIVNGNRAQQSEHDAAIWVHHGVSQAQINNNQIKGHRGHGISLTNAFPGAAATQMIQVSQNMVNDCHYKGKAAGLFWQDVAGLLVTGNMVSGCDLALMTERIADQKKRESDWLLSNNWLKGQTQGFLPEKWQSGNKIVG